MLSEDIQIDINERIADFHQRDRMNLFICIEEGDPMDDIIAYITEKNFMLVDKIPGYLFAFGLYFAPSHKPP